MKFIHPKYYIYVLLLLGLYSESFGQVITQMGDISLGGKGGEYLVKCIKTSDGGYLSIGNANNIDGDVSGPAQGNYDYWVIKTDERGTVQWNKLLGSSANDYVFDSTEDLINKGFVLIGYTESVINSGNISSSSKGGYSDIWVVKISEDGNNIQWETRIGGDEEDYGFSIQQSNDGNYLIAGFTNSTPNTGDLGGDLSRGGYDFRLIGLSASGTVQWDKRLGGSDYENEVENGGSISAIQTLDGGYLFAGRSYSNKSGDKSQNAIGDSDLWIIKLNKLREIEWDITLGGTDEETLTSILETNNGEYIIGSTTKSKDPVLGEPDDKDFWIIKLNSIGSVVWEYKYGGKLDDELKSVIQTLDGGFLLGGWSLSSNDKDKSQPNFGASDYWVIKLFEDGSKEWDAVYGGLQEDLISTILETRDGGYLLAGTSFSNVSGNKTAPSKGDADFWLLKLEGTVVLPIDLISFSAHRSSMNSVDLRWNTASEANNSHFTIERSTDNLSFNSILEILGAGNSNQVKSYSAIDNDPLHGISYYRLKQTDYNGKSTYSKIVSIVLPIDALNNYSIFPNPTDSKHLYLETKSSANNQKIVVLIEDIVGKKIVERVLYGDPINRVNLFNQHLNLNNGIYFLTIITSDGLIRKKVIIE
ncbi:T9SS type A sorting domain-containing protein [Rhodocytophaga rosea]|uniref:T9SS type A sorting domain-containing protein n=1 Tax=Rhodocytophaga rosea TaxID=2704465 RepID=A0A6C0GCR5_9BACT|nr:T9SS type A sorting domain-containing protein [Rhodocytophaga rosea]QHT65779.1 T9SS type A sorting domain-containing protein [Rhodocytophaga rosea]